MKTLFLFLITSTIGLSCAACLAAATGELPSDVKAFDAKRENCMHFSGEEPYDAKRKAYLIKQVKKYCSGNDKSLVRLKKKYANDAAVMAKLNSSDSGIE